MKVETPFDWAINNQPQKKDKYFLIETPCWTWAKTKNLVDGDDHYYDYGVDTESILFDCNVDCPVCGGNKSLVLMAGVKEKWHATAKWWVCLNCGEGESVTGEFGEKQVTPRNDQDDEVFLCPECIVVKVQI